VSERDRDVRDLQNALKGLESDKRRIGDDHQDDRRSLELEIDRVKRDLGRSEDDLDHAQREVDRLEQSLANLRSDLSDMVSPVQCDCLMIAAKKWLTGGGEEPNRVTADFGTSGAIKDIR